MTMPRPNPKSSDTFVAFILDQMQMIPELTYKRMFGGVGYYSGGIFFAIAYEGRLFFRTSEASRVAYERAGMPVFRPKERQTLGRYYEVPPHVVEDRNELLVWARIAVGSAEG